MQFDRIYYPKNPQDQDGLSAVDMKSLGNVVILAGRNGSGKTRFLKRLREWLTMSGHQTSTFIKQNIQGIDDRLTNVWEPKQRRELLEHRQRFADELSTLVCIEVGGTVGPHTILEFVPGKIDLSDPAQMTAAARRDAANVLQERDLAEAYHGALSLLQVVQDGWIEATHSNSEASPEERDKAVEKYGQVSSIVESTLHTKIGRSRDGLTTLFGLPLGLAKLSSGQSILLQLRLAAYSKGSHLAGQIITMDEPENHLHPSALIDAIEVIRAQIPHGQLWIATHSVPLISHFDPASLWWMENGTVCYAGSEPEKVLEGLVGDEERQGKLADFLGLPAHFASNRFAHESLIAPKVVGANQDDPQLKQIRAILCEVSAGLKVRLLDYGAGKGRLASSFHDSKYIDREKLETDLDYVAFDPVEEDKEACCAAITRIYGRAEGRYFNKAEELTSQLGEHTFDVIVMCNVLHEIIPGNWVKLFASNGTLTRLLKSDGFLLLVEDTIMPVGELAHQHGFLVLDTKELEALFQIKEADTGFVSWDERGDGRLKAHKIPAGLLRRITANSQSNALLFLQQRAMKQIRELRTKPASYRNGRKHAFWVQQLANAHLALDQLQSNQSDEIAAG